MELQILHWFESLHTPVLNYIMYGITCLGDKGIFWILLTLAALLCFPKQYRKAGLTMLIALAFSVVMCNGVMKNAFQRVRPFNVDPTFENLFGIFATIDDWSFPSGHTSASFAAAVALFMWYKKEGAYALVLAALISISRLYLTVHYPTDVLVSLILGSLYGVIAYVITIFIFRKSKKIHAVFEGKKPYKYLFAKSKKESK